MRNVSYKVELWIRDPEKRNQEVSPDDSPTGPPLDAPEIPASPKEHPCSDAPPPAPPLAPEPTAGPDNSGPSSSIPQRRGPSPGPDDAPDQMQKSRRIR